MANRNAVEPELSQFKDPTEPGPAPCFDCEHAGAAALPDTEALTAELPPRSGSSKYLFHELIKQAFIS